MSPQNRIKDMVYAGLFAALIAGLGLISIPLPISPVPITGQSLAIMLAGSILSARQAGLSVLTFLLIGAVGVPVFAGGTAGLGIIVGPRGGYLVGYLIGAIVISLLRGASSSIWRVALANIIGGIAVVYLFGASWLNFVTGMGLEKAIAAGVLPFIPGDLIKACVATMLAKTVRRQLLKANINL